MVTPSTDKTRIDKYLWSVRLFKTRSAATQACQGGKILRNGRPAKPAQPVETGDRIDISRPGWTKSIEVLAPLSRRIPAKEVDQYMRDITPEAEIQKARDRASERREAARLNPQPKHPSKGRPTKRHRRQMEAWSKFAEGSR